MDESKGNDIAPPLKNGGVAGEEEGNSEKKEWGGSRPRKVEPDTSRYFLSVAGALETTFADGESDAEEADAFLTNVFDEMKNQEGSLSADKKCSIVVEGMLKLVHRQREASWKKSIQLWRTFFANCKPYFGYLCYSRYASHVVQLLFSGSQDFVHGEMVRDEAPTSEDALPRVQDQICSLCEHLISTEEIWPLMQDGCGTHVLRSLILLLAGAQSASKEKSRLALGKKGFRDNKNNNPNEELMVPKSFSKILIKMLSMLEQAGHEHLRQAAVESYSSPVLQMLLRVSVPQLTSRRRRAIWSNLVRSLLGIVKSGADDEAASQNGAAFLDLMKHKSGSHVLECIFENCKDKGLMTDLVKLVKGKTKDLVRHPVANFVFQKILLRMTTEEELNGALDEIDGLVAEIFEQRRTGVLWRLAEACISVEGCQSRACRMIVKGIHEWKRNADKKDRKRSVAAASRGASVVLAALRLQSGPSRNESEQDGASQQQHHAVRVSVPGAQLISSFLRFKAEYVRLIAEGILMLSIENLLDLCRDPIGGRHVIEALFTAHDAFGFAKQRLADKLKGNFSLLANHKFGQHIVRKCYDAVSVKRKMNIVKELSESKERLLGSAYGRGLYRHCKVEMFVRHRADWQSALTEGAKKKKRMSDWLDSVDSAASKKKKKSHH